MKRYIILFFAMLFSASAMSQVRAEHASARAADADAIRKHIESIFAGFIAHDGPKLKATHSTEWTGFLEGSRAPIHGIDQYMQTIGDATTPSPNGMKSYKMLNFDPVFYGNVAAVPFVAEVEGSYNGSTWKNKLRIMDVYAKLDNGWIQVGSHTDVHPEALNAQMAEPGQLSDRERQDLLQAREQVWRAWFNNDRKALEALPAELIAIDDGSSSFNNRAATLDGAQQFAQSGGHLKSLEFPQTEIQVYGPVAIIYTKYKFEIERAGATTPSSGRATEVFVHRDGAWANVGWHLDHSQ